MNIVAALDWPDNGNCLHILACRHTAHTLSCVRGNNCELQKLAFDYGVDEDRFKGEDVVYPIDELSPYIVRDNNKCGMRRYN